MLSVASRMCGMQGSWAPQGMDALIALQAIQSVGMVPAADITCRQDSGGDSFDSLLGRDLEVSDDADHQPLLQNSPALAKSDVQCPHHNCVLDIAKHEVEDDCRFCRDDLGDVGSE